VARFCSANPAELRDAVAGALAAQEPVERTTGGVKSGLGRPQVHAGHLPHPNLPRF
jgi:hypothetical protein